MITGIVVQADEWNDLQQNTSHTVISNDNHAGNNNMLQHTCMHDIANESLQVIRMYHRSAGHISWM